MEISHYSTYSTLLLAVLLLSAPAPAHAQQQQPSIVQLLNEPFLDDYYSNVVYGYEIVTDTQKNASRYAGNRLNCSNCHLQAGTRKDALPLNVAGMYPKWRAKNGKRNGIGLRIRECFLYSMDGIMPPEDAPEVLAISAYVTYLSQGQVMGAEPEGRGIPTLPDTGYDPNPANGRAVYLAQCASCHGQQGEGLAGMPPVWGLDSYNKGAGMNRIREGAGFIWANMPLGSGKSLTHQQALDVSAYLNLQIRPADPRASKFLKLMEHLIN
ncbi:MAG: c-type cytochrome [Pseudomonadales bacterium]|nr:c-type cytochrome [Pseudomonadales bacterium]